MTVSLATPLGSGIHHGIGSAVYHAIDAASSGRLRNMGRSAAYCRYRIDTDEDDDTEARVVGSVADAFLLDPDALEDFAVAGACAATLKSGAPCSNTGSVTDGSEWYCGVRGHAPEGAGPSERRVLTQKAWDRARGIHEAITASSWWSSLSDVWTQTTVLWEDVDGVLCRARPDILAEGGEILCDLKVCRQATQDKYLRACVGLWHPQQLAWYARGLFAVGRPCKERWILAVQPDPPHEVCAYRMTPELNAWADGVVSSRLDWYSECARTNSWPAGHDAMDVPLPEWAMSDEVRTEDDEIATEED